MKVIKTAFFNGTGICGKNILRLLRAMVVLCLIYFILTSTTLFQVFAYITNSFLLSTLCLTLVVFAVLVHLSKYLPEPSSKEGLS